MTIDYHWMDWAAGSNRDDSWHFPSFSDLPFLLITFFLSDSPPPDLKQIGEQRGERLVRVRLIRGNLTNFLLYRPDGIGTVTVEEKDMFNNIKDRLKVLLEHQITHFR